MVSNVCADPQTIQDALSSSDSKEWEKATAEELSSLHTHRTWIVVKEPERARSFSARFVFTRRLDEHGNISRYKARLVVRGYRQGSIDHTFAAAISFVTIHTCLVVAVQKRYLIHQLDMHTAVLHGEMDSDVYVKAADVLTYTNLGRSRYFRGGLYGLKQALRHWYETFCSIMEALQFTKLTCDSSLFRRGNVWLLLHVDDILLMRANEAEIINVKERIGMHLDVKDLGSVRSFVGIIFSQDKCGACLSRGHYIPQVLERFGVLDCRAVSAPQTENGLAEVMVDSAYVDKQKYQELLGCLLFLATRTRPDICAHVTVLCRLASSPNQAHWVMLKRILRYLHATQNYGLRLLQEGSYTMKVFRDADWGADRSDRKTTSAILVQLGNSAVAWRILKQKVVAL